MSSPERTDPPLAGDEAATLLGFLEFHRETLRWKTSGLDAEGLARALPPSDMTLGALLKHLASVEDYWFGQILLGRQASPPFGTAPWDVDPDWDWHSAADDAPETLHHLLAEAIARSQEATSTVLAAGGLDALSAGRSRRGEQFSLRWILVHMIEEYARHNGHADLLRQAVDGLVGE